MAGNVELSARGDPAAGFSERHRGSCLTRAILPSYQLRVAGLYSGVAQLVEHHAHNVKVAGSIPAPAT